MESLLKGASSEIYEKAKFSFLSISILHRRRRRRQWGRRLKKYFLLLLLLLADNPEMGILCKFSSIFHNTAWVWRKNFLFSKCMKLFFFYFCSLLLLNLLLSLPRRKLRLKLDIKGKYLPVQESYADEFLKFLALLSSFSLP